MEAVLAVRVPCARIVILMLQRRRTLPLAALLALLPALPPVIVPPALAQDAPARKRNIGGPGDYQLRARLTQAILRDPELASERFTLVLVNGGTVFSGSISSYALKMRLLRLTGFTRGVRNITDEMTVQRAELSDASLKEAVIDFLSDSSEELGLKDLEVEIEDAVVTLRGAVRRFPSRTRAEVLTGSVQGVTRVVDQIIPEDVPDRADHPSLAASVAAYLRDFRAFPHIGEFEVADVDGTVTLSGRVGYYYARRQAEVMAGLVDGVREVENNIKVDPSLFMKRIEVGVRQ
jgi:osmotically-inducible protein OsmY